MEPLATIPLRYRGRTRAGWLVAGVVGLLLGALTTWAMVWATPPLPALLIQAGLAGAYGWLGSGAVGIGAARGASLIVGRDRLVVRHDFILGAPIEVARATVEAVLVDPRPDEERRAAASSAAAASPRRPSSTARSRS